MYVKVAHPWSNHLKSWFMKDNVVWQAISMGGGRSIIMDIIYISLCNATHIHILFLLLGTYDRNLFICKGRTSFHANSLPELERWSYGFCGKQLRQWQFFRHATIVASFRCDISMVGCWIGGRYRIDFFIESGSTLMHPSISGNSRQEGNEPCNINNC